MQPRLREWQAQSKQLINNQLEIQELSKKTEELLGEKSTYNEPVNLAPRSGRSSFDQAKALILEFLLSPDLQLPLDVAALRDTISNSILEWYLRDLSSLHPFLRRYFDRLLDDLAEKSPLALKLDSVHLATDKKVFLFELNPKELVAAYFDLTGSMYVPLRFLSSSASSSSSGLKSKRARIISQQHPGGSGSAEKPKHEDEEAMFTESAIEALIAEPTAEERRETTAGLEVMSALHSHSAHQLQLRRQYSTTGMAIRPYCAFFLRETCAQKNPDHKSCKSLHFRKLIRVGLTDESQGDCSYLDTCRHYKTCRFLHYEIDPQDLALNIPMPMSLPPPERPSEWINCDIRTFPFELLGTFGVIMADPPWDIHMELPYGTMSDDEMRGMNIQTLQTDGYIFLWVTGRAMELGRECLTLWGYDFVQELIWVKINQLQRLIRTGRTGHWLNHSKEHCLVGVKGKPQCNMYFDTDVLVSEVRETSRKPDEIYTLLERLSPGTRKLELFGRQHNLHNGWMTLGNQLNGVNVADNTMRESITTHLNKPKPTTTVPSSQPAFSST